MKKVVVLGATGFVGQNIAEFLENKCTVIKTSRQQETRANFVYFDLQNPSSWKNIYELHPDIIINSAAYGVVKTQQELAPMYDINYFKTTAFYKFLQEKLNNVFWIQLGTAFEYDLSVGDIIEESPCLPQTHYGISKLMATNYLLEYGKVGQFIVLRPFGMFGKYEDKTKLFPALISAQIEKKIINLSSGVQQRDYMFVGDLANFIYTLIIKTDLKHLPKLMNLGSGTYKSLRKIAEAMASTMPDFQSNLWNWGDLEQRKGESSYFYNHSKLAFQYGLTITEMEKAFSAIIESYKKPN